MARRYAADTVVTPERTRSEIHRLLLDHGARNLGFQSDDDNNVETIAFTLYGRDIRVTFPLPEPSTFAYDGAGRSRSAVAMRNARDKEVRRLWRALLLIIRAKLEAVADGVRGVDDEWLADTVMEGGATVGEWVAPRLRMILEKGSSPEIPMLPAKTAQ